MLKNLHTLFIFIICALFSQTAFAQNQVVQDYTKLLNIPDVTEIEASASHLYVLSESEGMAVFRAYGDSLQWLYTSSGMQRRGYKIESDIRFAYLYGDSKRLTVLEPTSVLGVYSSTLLPERPLGVARLQNSLFIALGNQGLGKLSLETPETVDSEADIVANDIIERANVLDVASSVISNQLFVLTNRSQIHVFTAEDDSLLFSSTVQLNTQINKLFLDNGRIWGGSSSGEIYEVNTNGLGRRVGSINEFPTDIINWRNYLFVRGSTGRIWQSFNNGSLREWKTERQAGNHITKGSYTVWMNIYGNLSPLKIVDGESPNTGNLVSAELRLKPMDDIILTYPNPLLHAIEFEESYPATDVELTYHSSATNAVLKKQGLYWQPTVNQVGYTRFTIIATNSIGDIDSTSFAVDVRTFNSPPRFSPVRSTSVVVGDPFQLQINAIDPENPQNSLIRYLGVDLPDGAMLDEQTGLFKWTPAARQVGENTFRVIATDEQGAASTQDITLKVIDLAGEGQE